MIFVYATHLVVFLVIFIEFYNYIHSTFINIGLPTDPLVEDGVLMTQHYWLEWPKT